MEAPSLLRIAAARRGAGLTLSLLLSLPASAAVAAAAASALAAPPGPYAVTATPAAEPPAASALELEVLRNRAVAALARKDFTAARRPLARWIELAPASREARVLEAKCLLELSQLVEAQGAYAVILATAPDDIESNIGLARIAARRAEVEANPEARERLLEEARRAIASAAAIDGAAIRATRTYRELWGLRADVTFMFDLLSVRRDAPEPPAHGDPFVVKLTRIDPAGKVIAPPPGSDPENDAFAREAALRALAEQIPELVAELDAAVGRGELPEITRAFGVLDESVRRVAALCGNDRTRRERILAPLEARRPLLRAVRLRLFDDDGERILAAIRAAAASDDSAKVCEEGARLDALARDMVAADKDFAAVAQDLVSRARPALERARALAELSSIPLEVSAIVVGGGDALSIVNGRIVSAGEFVPDAAGVPIPGLVVEEVKRRRVKLSYKGHVFEPRRQLTSK